MAANFNASTKEVLSALGLESSKSLFRRRTDYVDSARATTQRFLEPNIHFRKKTPGSTRSSGIWSAPNAPGKPP